MLSECASTAVLHRGELRPSSSTAPTNGGTCDPKPGSYEGYVIIQPSRSLLIVKVAPGPYFPYLHICHILVTLNILIYSYCKIKTDLGEFRYWYPRML